MTNPNLPKRLDSESLFERNQQKVIQEEQAARVEQARHYLRALKRHNKQSERLFNYWKELREEERKTRKKYAGWILTVAGIQSVVVYIWAFFCFVRFESTTFLEVFGLSTLVCSQTFGLVFVVVKYFFGQKPEGLSEITQFISKTCPISPLSPVPDKKIDKK